MRKNWSFWGGSVHFYRSFIENIVCLCENFHELISKNFLPTNNHAPFHWFISSLILATAGKTGITQFVGEHVKVRRREISSKMCHDLPWMMRALEFASLISALKCEEYEVCDIIYHQMWVTGLFGSIILFFLFFFSSNIYSKKKTINHGWIELNEGEDLCMRILQKFSLQIPSISKKKKQLEQLKKNPKNCQ